MSPVDPLAASVAARFLAQMEEMGVIRKEKGEYCVRSPNNPKWNGGCYPSKEKAEDRRGLAADSGTREMLAGLNRKDQKIWGVAAQLYLLRSERNWGIGDFTDLYNLIDIAAEWGASVVGLNPLHALFIDDPEQASPYAPASRLYLNILNIDVTSIPEFATCEDAKSLLRSKDFTSALDAVRTESLVDYGAVAELKLWMLGPFTHILQRTLVLNDGAR